MFAPDDSIAGTDALSVAPCPGAPTVLTARLQPELHGQRQTPMGGAQRSPH